MLFRVQVHADDGSVHVASAAINHKRILTISPDEKGRHRILWALPKPMGANVLPGLYVSSVSIPDELFTTEPLVPFQSCDQNGVPIMGPAAINMEAVTHIVEVPVGGKNVYCMYTVLNLHALAVIETSPLIMPTKKITLHA